jgi:hypothetical protein
MTDYRWLSPRKLRENCVDYGICDVEEAEKQLYFAVISGEVRARSQGKLFGPKLLQQMARMKFHDDNPFALPPDIELSVDDARRKWSVPAVRLH